MKLSIITTMYCSAAYVNEFYLRITEEAKKITDDYEIIFINDGSPDRSLNLALEIYEKDDKVKVVDFSRNFGHHKALMTGLSLATGEMIFIIDIDLEEPPELLGIYYKRLIEEPDCDVVYGMQTARKGKLFEKVTGDLAYRIINVLSGLDMPRNYSLSRLMTRRYVRSLVQYREQELYIGGLWYLTGYKQVSVPIIKKSRGISTYSLGKKIDLFITAVTSMSSKLLVYIFICGLIVTFISCLAILYTVISWFASGQTVPGWTSILVTLLFLGGLIILFLGIIGFYISKMYIETKDRPYTIIRAIYDENMRVK
ncbi:MAG: glycosyltransferase family 2 protein [Dehalococcoidia bacterium]|nr:glycosyltransferase family 2 protein [Dehalococcoidia bacterium]